MNMQMVLIAAIMATEGVLCAAAGAGFAVWAMRDRISLIHHLYAMVRKDCHQDASSKGGA